MFLTEHIFNHNNTVKGPLIYITSSLFLYNCFKYLISMGENEVMHFVTGIKLGHIRTLDYMQKVTMKCQSPVYVETEINSVFKVLGMMDEEFGHYLHAYFHSHPGSFSSPSGIDVNYQKRLEAGHYNAIGVIFTRDGQIRFFSHKLPFTVEVYGKGVEQIEDTLFQFTKTDLLESKTTQEDTQNGIVRNRQTRENQRIQPGNIWEFITKSHRGRGPWK